MPDNSSGGKTKTDTETGAPPQEKTQEPIPSPNNLPGNRRAPRVNPSRIPRHFHAPHKPFVPVPKFNGVAIPPCGTKLFSFPVKFETQSNDYDSRTKTQIMKDIGSLAGFLKVYPKLQLTIGGNVSVLGGSPILGNSPLALNQTGFGFKGDGITAANLMIKRAQSVHSTMNMLNVKNIIKPATGSVLIGEPGLMINFYITNPCK